MFPLTQFACKVPVFVVQNATVSDCVCWLRSSDKDGTKHVPRTVCNHFQMCYLSWDMTAAHCVWYRPANSTPLWHSGKRKQNTIRVVEFLFIYTVFHTLFKGRLCTFVWPQTNIFTYWPNDAMLFQPWPTQVIHGNCHLNKHLQIYMYIGYTLHRYNLLSQK